MQKIVDLNEFVFDFNVDYSGFSTNEIGNNQNHLMTNHYFPPSSKLH